MALMSFSITSLTRFVKEPTEVISRSTTRSSVTVNRQWPYLIFSKVVISTRTFTGLTTRTLPAMKPNCRCIPSARKMIRQIRSWRQRTRTSLSQSHLVSLPALSKRSQISSSIPKSSWLIRFRRRLKSCKFLRRKSKYLSWVRSPNAIKELDIRLRKTRSCQSRRLSQLRRSLSFSGQMPWGLREVIYSHGSREGSMSRVTLS